MMPKRTANCRAGHTAAADRAVARMKTAPGWKTYEVMSGHDVMLDQPDRLVEAARTFGKTARVPMLWVYTQNDTFFEPALSKRMAEAFASSGGKAEYVLLPSFARDGHTLFGASAGLEYWAPLVAKYLAAQGF